MAKAGRDPEAKRAHETHWEWRSRVAAQKQAEANAKEAIVTKEAERHGLDREFVTHTETGTVTTSYRRKTRSALEYMRQQGSLSDEQYYSAQRIAQIAEMIEKQVSLGCASMEARVDCSGSARDALNESLYRVRAEAAYTEWRHRLPLPRRMVIDMVTQDAGLSRIASEHNMGWPKARRILTEALDRWPEIFARYVKQIDAEDLAAQHARLAR